MPNFSQQKKDWYSPPFHTGPGGYRMCLRVCTVGKGSGLGSHVSAFVHLMRSENDSKLKWPLSAVVTVQIVNFRENKNHVEMKARLSALSESQTGVQNRDRSERGVGVHEFIKRDNLRLDVMKNTEYLRNDCISFRILNVIFNK